MKVQTETVVFYLYDVGRLIDLKKIALMIPAHPDLGTIKKRRDSPTSLSLPVPLIVQLAKMESNDGLPFDAITLRARIFEDGVISMTVRVKGKFSLKELYSVRTTPFVSEGEITTVDSWVESSFTRFLGTIKECVTTGLYVFPEFVRESYTAFCVTTPIENPEEFVHMHRKTIACLLNSESPDANLHESQIVATLRNPFRYTDNDYALFDLDHCFIIDPDFEYEDILLILEQAKFQLLELRTLDMLLDRWIDQAENDIKIIFKNNSARLKPIKAKLASVHALSFDALFILENLENSSKLIGDYFLGQVFKNLCEHFNTEGWIRSIERRLATLASVYERVNANANEKRMLFLEIMFIVVCVVFPILQIIQTFLLAK